MGPELEVKSKPQAVMEVPVVKETGVIHIDPEDTFMPCVSNYNDNSYDLEAPGGQAETWSSNVSENAELNITTCPSANDVQMVEIECGDLTESSSSFGNTNSGTENGSVLDGDEVESRFCENPSVSLYDGYSDAFHTRKKKLTDQWRKFIRPLMWRCKWLELQIKRLQSQTLKYDKELAEYDKLKQFEFGGLTTEGHNGKSIPFSSHTERNKFMKRKKRKRIEVTTDIVSYTSNHKLFSYFENKRFSADGASIEEDCGNLADDKPGYGINEFEIDFRDGDSTLEDTLRKIEVVRSQVWQLKARIDKVVTENCAFLGFAQSPASESEDELLTETVPTASQHISSTMGTLLLPGSAVPNHEDLNPLPSMLENTNQPSIGGAHDNAEDGYLIPNGDVKKDENFAHTKDQLMQLPRLSIGKKRTKTVTLEPDSTTRTSFPWNTRNRGKRKAGSYRLSRKS